jgi:hypothetical protein
MFVRITILLVVFAAIWSGLAHASGSGQSGSYVVKPGDTLWSIASRTYRGDVRKGVWDLEQRNGLGESAILVPGERLVVPRQ